MIMIMFVPGQIRLLERAIRDISSFAHMAVVADESMMVWCGSSVVVGSDDVDAG